MSFNSQQNENQRQLSDKKINSRKNVPESLRHLPFNSQKNENQQQLSDKKIRPRKMYQKLSNNKYG